MRESTITLKWAQTLDGQLCDDRGNSKWISGDAERRLTHAIRAENDGILVGARTYLNDRAQLTVRDAPTRGSQPVRILLDPRGRVSDYLERADPSERAWFATDLHSPARRTYLIGKPGSLRASDHLRFVAQELDLAVVSFAKDFREAIRSIAREECLPSFRLLVEGGPRILTHFLQHHLFDEVQISISPRFTGGKLHRIELARDLPESLALEPVENRALGPDTFLRLRKRANA